MSSNDGSHLALARALALRNTTTIDPEVGLTLWVDRAEREGHAYSDRPPGTAFAALPAVWLGDRLDRPIFERSYEQRDIIVTPAARNFAETYTARSKRLRAEVVPLLALQGTALMLDLHAIAIGLLGLWGVDLLARRRGLSPGARTFATLALGLCTLWGPYSTVLFSHVTTATLLVLSLYTLERVGEDDRSGAAAGWAMAAGLFGAWAVAADYLAVLLIAPLFALGVPWRSRPRAALWIGVGAAPIVAATLGYHDAAFGSPLAIGYDHHANFAFARTRASTFDGNPLDGLWTLWGLGRDAGVLALAPVTLVGLAGLAKSKPRWLLAALPWALVLALHHTPWGGASEDHRYLVPILPLAGLGLAHAWTTAGSRPGGRWLQLVMIVIAVLSAALVWSHFIATTRG